MPRGVLGVGQPRQPGAVLRSADGYSEDWTGTVGSFSGLQKINAALAVTPDKEGFIFPATGTFAVTLPQGSSIPPGFDVTVLTTSGTQTVTPVGGALVNGAASLAQSVANVAWTYVFDGTNWAAVQMPADSLNLAGTTSASSATTGTLTVGNGTAATNVGVGGGIVIAGTGFGVGALPTSSLAVNISSAIAGQIGTKLQNTNNGSGSFAAHNILNDAGAQLSFEIVSSGFTPVGAIGASTGGVICNASGGLFLVANGGPLLLGAGSTAERGRVSTAGNLLLGVTVDTGITGAGGISTANTTDASAVGTAAWINPGGQSIAKTLLHAKGRGAGVAINATVSGTITLTIASAEIQTFTGSTAGTIVQFPAANLFGAGIAVLYVINNQSSVTVTPTRAGADTFQGGGTTDAVLTNTTTRYASDGVSKWLRV